MAIKTTVRKATPQELEEAKRREERKNKPVEKPKE